MVKGRKASAEDKKGNPNSEEDPTGKGVGQRRKANSGAENKVIRRSDRIKGFVSPNRIQKGKASVVAHILVSDTEEKDDDDDDEEEKEVKQEGDRTGTNNQPVGNGLSLEQKVDYLIQAVNEITSSQHFARSPDNNAQLSTSSGNGLDPEQKVDNLVKAVDEIKSQYFARNPDVYVSRYPGLDPELEKKIEDLMEKNYKLVKEWEFAKGQYEVYRNFFHEEKIDEPTAADDNGVLSNPKMMQNTYKRRSAATRSSSRANRNTTKRKVSMS